MWIFQFSRSAVPCSKLKCDYLVWLNCPFRGFESKNALLSDVTHTLSCFGTVILQQKQILQYSFSFSGSFIIGKAKIQGARNRPCVDLVCGEIRGSGTSKTWDGQNQGSGYSLCFIYEGSMIWCSCCTHKTSIERYFQKENRKRFWSISQWTYYGILGFPQSISASPTWRCWIVDFARSVDGRFSSGWVWWVC